MTPSPKSPFATAKEVADLLHVSTSYVYALLRRGILPGIRIGNCWRIDLRRLGDYVSTNRLMKDAEPENLSLQQSRFSEPDDAASRPPTDQEYQDLLQENQSLKLIVKKQQERLAELRKDDD